MAKIERYRPTQVDEVSTIVRRFATHGRAMVEAATRQGLGGNAINSWYQDFCASVDHRFGAILYMYAKYTPGIRRTVILGKNGGFGEEKVYGPRYWNTDGLSYDIMQIRHKNRRGPVKGAELSVAVPTIVETLGNIKFYDDRSKLTVDWFYNPYASVVMEHEGFREVGAMNIVMALDKAVRTVETMPGVLPPQAHTPPASVLDVSSYEITPES